MSEVVIHARNVLPGADLDVVRGAFIDAPAALLSLIAALTRPSCGELVVLGTNVAELDEASAARWRNRHIGIVFPQPDLIPGFTALQNVELPLKLTHLKYGERVQRAAAALRRTGLADGLNQRPSQLSEGDQWLAAIARAIATEPEILLCHRLVAPTLLHRLNEELGLTIVVAVH